MQNFLRCTRLHRRSFQCLKQQAQLLRLPFLLPSQFYFQQRDGLALPSGVRHFGNTRAARDEYTPRRVKRARKIIQNRLTRDGSPYPLPFSNTKTFSVFVKNLAFSVTNEQLAEEFSEFGTVVSARLLMDKTGKSLGSGFVDFNSTQAQKAARSADGKKTIDGWPVVIKSSEYRAREERKYTTSVEDLPPVLFVDNVRSDTFPIDLWKFFNHFAPVKYVRVPYNTVLGRKKSKGYAFVEFFSSEDAKKVYERRQAAYYRDRVLKLEFSTTRNTIVRNVDGRNEGDLKDQDLEVPEIGREQTRLEDSPNADTRDTDGVTIEDLMRRFTRDIPRGIRSKSVQQS